MQKLQNEQAYLEAMLALKVEFNQKTEDTEQQLTNNLARQKQLQTESTRRSNEMMRQAEQDLVASKRAAMGEGLNILVGMLKKNTVAYKAALIGQRAFAIAQIVIDSNREMAGIGANPYVLAMPPAVREAYIAKVGLSSKIRAGIAIAGIVGQTIQDFADPGTALSNQDAPKSEHDQAVDSINKSEYRKEVKQEMAQKDDGGFTGIGDLYGGAQGFVSSPTRVNAGRRSYIVGERRKEWIMGGAMLAAPGMADIAGMLESIQRTGAYRNMPMGSTASQGSGVSDTLLMGILQELKMNRDVMASFGDRPVSFNYREFEQYKSNIDQVRTTNSL